MFRKPFRFIGGAVPLLIICADPLTHIDAADEPVKPAHLGNWNNRISTEL
jgi:hypothetical protein